MLMNSLSNVGMTLYIVHWLFATTKRRVYFFNKLLSSLIIQFFDKSGLIEAVFNFFCSAIYAIRELINESFMTLIQLEIVTPYDRNAWSNQF